MTGDWALTACLGSKDLQIAYVQGMCAFVYLMVPGYKVNMLSDD